MLAVSLGVGLVKDASQGSDQGRQLGGRSLFGNGGQVHFHQMGDGHALLFGVTLGA